MPDYRETFKRKEVKYRLNASQRARIEEEAAKHLSLSRFGKSTVSSLYFDTPTHSVIGRSLEKPLYKEKVRLRWYGSGPLRDASTVYLELKKKFKGIVYKRRVRVAPQSAIEFCKAGNPDAFEVDYVDDIPRYTQDQIMKEIRAACRRHEGLRTSALIRCARVPYEEDDPQGLRITFDGDLVGSDLMDGAMGIPLLRQGESIMEIKCNGAYPLWLAHLLTNEEAYPRSFSKYGELYKIRAAQAQGRMKHAG